MDVATLPPCLRRQTAFELIEDLFPEKGKARTLRSMIDIGARFMAVHVPAQHDQIDLPAGTHALRRQFS
jgi:hypothetical protein